MVALPPFARRECLAHPYLPAFLQPSPTHHPQQPSPTHQQHARQWFVPAPAASFAVIPQTYTPLRSHLSPGVIVAIVLGSLLGAVLLLALLWLLLGACACCGRRRGGVGGGRRTAVGNSEKYSGRRRAAESSSSSYWSRSVLSEGVAAARARARRGDGGVNVRATPRGFVRKTERVVSRRAREPDAGRYRDAGYAERRAAVRRDDGAGGRRRGGGGDEVDEVVVIEEDERRRGGGGRRARGGHQALDEVVVIEEDSPPKGMRRKPTGRRAHRDHHHHRDARSAVSGSTSQTGSHE